MASIFLNGISLANFRGIGKEMQMIAPFREINFLIGPNNSGKSTVLRFLSRYLGQDSGRHQNTWQRSFDPLDINVDGHGAQPIFGIAVTRASLEERIQSEMQPRHQQYVAKILDALSDGELIFLYADSANSRQVKFKENDPIKLKQILAHDEWRDLWHALTGSSGGDMNQNWMPGALTKLANMPQLSFPKVLFVPAIREIGAAGNDFTDYSGRGLIDKLAELQNPPHNEREKRRRFELINDFLRAVTDSSDAMIEVPHDRKHLTVHMNGKVLPLISLGTGIHEVIMLASFCTLVEDEIICIEEPEIHLHPLLQRKLIRYLRDKTSNQYFIATHSSSLIDSVSASIFNVELVDNATRITLAAKPSDRHDICRQLGYLASDLLQSNAIIWVEGPSDRIYLNHWIKKSASELVEGLDYSIMFYGGRLLSHLSADDPEVSDFISLRRLNRNIFVLIDSDKKFQQSKINATKQRILDEFGENFSWLTAGREIENYVPAEVLSTALEELYRDSFLRVADDGRYAHRLDFLARGREDEIREADKVKVAKLVCRRDADFTELDLRDQLDKLLLFIRNANHTK